MAKKKEEGLTYLQVPLPQGQKKGKMTKLDWSGLNYRNTKDTGEISKELNISMHFAPYLTPSEVKKEIKNGLFEQYYQGETLNSNTYNALGISSTDIYYLEGYYIVQGYYEENKTIGSTSEIIQKCIYQVYDKEFNLMQSVMTEKVPGNYSGASVIGFRYFENYKDITQISTGKKVLYFPRGSTAEGMAAHSQSMPEVIVLKRHFHDAKTNVGLAWTLGEYLADNCTQRGVYYLIECATDKDKDGNPLFPGGTGNSDDDYNTKNHNKDNSLVAYTNSGRGGWLTKYYFNIKQPYCIKDGTTGYYGLNEAESVKIDEASFITEVPDIYYACTAHQRLFGINSTQVFASGYNDYANWALDTATEYSTENAWMSSTQSSDGGKNVGIISYGGSVFVFKENSTLEIVNTKNPFRINEIFSVGAICQKGIQVVGNYLIFVTHDGVRLYNGSSLKDIGYKLNIEKVNSVVSGTDGRKFYMSAEINDETKRRLFVYDSLTGLWAEEDVGEETVTITIPSEEATEDENGNVTGETTEEVTRQIEFVGFTKSDDGFLGLTSSGKIYRLDTKEYGQEWYIETDFFTNNTVDIKHINKVQLLADIKSGSELRAYILYDDEEFNPDTSHKIFDKKNETEKTIKLPIRVIPRHTANYGFKIRIEGYGFVKLYQMEVAITGGGEKNISG